MLTDAMIRLRRDFDARIAANDFHISKGGIVVPGIDAGHPVGVYETSIRRRGAAIAGERQIDFNLIPTQGLNHILDNIDGGTTVAAWYIGLFKGNYTPLATDEGDSWAADATEFEDYDEGERQEWITAAAAAGSKSNAASKAEFTIAEGIVNQSIYGAALAQAQPLLGNTGKLLSIARFGSARVVNATDVLVVQFTLTLTSA